jgi:hypothetical protein
MKLPISVRIVIVALSLSFFNTKAFCDPDGGTDSLDEEVDWEPTEEELEQDDQASYCADPDSCFECAAPDLDLEDG